MITLGSPDRPPLALKTTIILCLLPLAFLLGMFAERARATTTESMDSVWWRGLSEDEQVSAVQGLISAYGNGYNDGFIAAKVQVVEVLGK